MLSVAAADSSSVETNFEDEMSSLFLNESNSNSTENKIFGGAYNRARRFPFMVAILDVQTEFLVKISVVKLTIPCCNYTLIFCMFHVSSVRVTTTAEDR